jgi:hypothetical protein
MLRLHHFRGTAGTDDSLAGEGEQGRGRKIHRTILLYRADRCAHCYIEKVALLDIDIQEERRAVAGLVDSFPENTNSIIFRQLDVTDGAAVQAVTNELSESLGGRIGVLVLRGLLTRCE